MFSTMPDPQDCIHAFCRLVQPRFGEWRMGLRHPFCRASVRFSAVSDRIRTGSIDNSLYQPVHQYNILCAAVACWCIPFEHIKRIYTPRVEYPAHAQSSNTSTSSHVIFFIYFAGL